MPGGSLPDSKGSHPDPRRAWICLVLSGVEERTLNKPSFCLILTVWLSANASPSSPRTEPRGLRFLARPMRALGGVISKCSEPQLSHVKTCSGLSGGRNPGAHGDHASHRAGG